MLTIQFPNAQADLETLQQALAELDEELTTIEVALPGCAEATDMDQLLSRRHTLTLRRSELHKRLQSLEHHARQALLIENALRLNDVWKPLAEKKRQTALSVEAALRQLVDSLEQWQMVQHEQEAFVRQSPATTVLNGAQWQQSTLQRLMDARRSLCALLMQQLAGWRDAGSATPGLYGIDTAAQVFTL